MSPTRNQSKALIEIVDLVKTFRTTAAIDRLNGSGVSRYYHWISGSRRSRQNHADPDAGRTVAPNIWNYQGSWLRSDG